MPSVGSQDALGPLEKDLTRYTRVSHLYLEEFCHSPAPVKRKIAPMLVFVTLFLGLVTGQRAVELSTGDRVTTVEARLDGKVVARVTQAPWKFNVDFGDTPKPHFLSAVAFDAEGAEVAKVFQRINLPRALAEATLILVPGTGGKDRFVRLSWQCAVAAEPSKVVVTFDGKPIPYSDPRKIALPTFVPEQLHFMKADLDFPRNITASAEITFGGQSRDETQAELTAVAVLGGPRKLPPLEGLVLTGGKPARVVAVEEEGPAEIAIVLDEAARQTFATMGARYESPRRLDPRFGASAGDQMLRGIAPLGAGQRARFVWPLTETFSTGKMRFEIFPRSEDFDRSEGGLLYLLTHVFAPGVPDEPRLADAAAVAALTAVARNRTRAVVLVLGGSRDGSSLSPAGARAYLSALGVPLFVWTAGARGAAEAATWSGATEVADVSTPKLFAAAADRLRAHLERQRIVWLEGVHLPQDVELSPSASGVTLVR